jgi:hypothetical protein
MIYRRNPKLFAGTGLLFPQNQQNTLDKAVARKLPPARTWLLLVAAVVVAWLLVAQYAWTAVTGDLSCLMCRISGGNCACQVGGGQ